MGTALMDKMYTVALDFFFNVEAGAEVLAKTDWLSPNTRAIAKTPLHCNKFTAKGTRFAGCLLL
jgi:hypothetical protein